MTRKQGSTSLVTGLLLLVAASVAQAADRGSTNGPIIDLSINAAPDEMNRDVDDIVGSQALNDDAYMYQGTVILSRQSSVFPIVKAKYSYIGARAFRFIDRYTDECDGAAELEGIGGFYGNRYMVTHDSYEGLGAGWYAGAASVTDKWVECDGQYAGEEESLIPLAAGEVFYKWHPTDLVFVEPAVLLALNKESSSVSLLPQLNVGLEFH